MILFLILSSCSFIPRIATGPIPEVEPVNPDALVSYRYYHVDNTHPDASDSNPGTAKKPWLTIQHAADTAGPGDTVFVHEGLYPERVAVNNSGSSAKYLVFKAVGIAEIRGFQLYGNCIGVIGFTILDDIGISGWLGSGVWVSGNYQYIADNTIKEFINSNGIMGTWGKYSKNIHIKGNYFYRCNAGICINGENWLVEDNEIERLYRGPDGGDADYFRFFGKNNIIRRNIMHGTIEAEIGVSHVDLFQTFDNNGEIAHDILVEKNIGIGMYHQGLMLSGSHQSMRNIIFRENVFAGGSSWGFCIYGTGGVHILNNTIFGIEFHGIGFNDAARGVVKNNIIAYCTTSYWADGYAVVESGYNIIWQCRDDPGIYSSTDMIGVDPLFNLAEKPDPITLSDILGPDGIAFTADDGLALRKYSPANGTGEDGQNIGAY